MPGRSAETSGSSVRMIPRTDRSTRSSARIEAFSDGPMPAGFLPSGKCVLRALDPVPGAIELSQVPERPCVQGAQDRGPANRILREGFDPAAQFLEIPLAEELASRRLEQPGGPFDPVPGDRIPHGLGEGAVLFVPFAGPVVERRDFLRMLGAQAASEEFGEKGMVAVPETMIVQPEEEQVPVLQRFDHVLAVPAAGEHVAQGRGQPVQDGRFHQELAHDRGLAAEDALQQVIGDFPLRSREGVHEPAGVSLPGERHGRELQPGDPSFRPAAENTNLVVGQRQAARFLEVIPRLVDVEPQVVPADLQDFPANTEALDGQAGIPAGPYDETDIGRSVPEQKFHDRMDGAVADFVEVIQERHDRGVRGAEVMDQAFHHVFDQHVRVRPEISESLPADVRPCRLDGGDQVDEEPAGLVIAGIEREPGGRHLAFLEGQVPLGEQGCFPGTRGCGDERKPKGAGILHLVGKPGTRQVAGTQGGRSQLRRKGSTLEALLRAVGSSVISRH